MKSRIAVFLIVLAVFASAAHAQGNCCEIQVQGPNIGGGPMTVPSSSTAPNNGPGGTYYPSKVIVYNVACYNATAKKACNAASASPNSITVTGYGANFNGQFRSCNQSYKPETVQASSTSDADASFTDTGSGWQDHLDANGNCIPQNPQAQDVSYCIAQACPVTIAVNCGCCSGPVVAKLLETPQKKDVKLGKAQASSCPYDCACCPPACSPASPIMIDLTGAGFLLTDAAHGVPFDIRGTGKAVQVAWTAPGAQNAFLCLPDANGSCDDGKDLFGNFTPQPPSSTPNGFAALAVYDQPANGGNGDSIIDSHDGIFSSLRLWIDANHDGISQPSELFTLPSLGVTSISLNYKSDQRTDQYGNIFRYRAPVGSTSGAGHIAYDVFLVIQTSNAVTAQSCPAVPSRLLPEEKDGRLH